MKNRKKIISILAGILAAVMLLGIIAGALPTYVSAADNRSSAEIQAEINALKAEQDMIQEQIGELEGQISVNYGEMEAMVEFYSK